MLCNSPSDNTRQWVAGEVCLHQLFINCYFGTLTGQLFEDDVELDSWTT